MASCCSRYIAHSIHSTKSADEAHYIKERTTYMAKACFSLHATHRWAVTGTPVINKLDDLFSLVKFLRLEPWNQFVYWKTFIGNPFAQKDVKVMDTVQTLIDPILLRRTKDMQDENGDAIVKLPEKTIHTLHLDFSKEERGESALHSL